MRLTNSLIDRAKYPRAGGGSRYVIWDSAVVGLGLRVYPSGKKVFVTLSKVEGRSRLFTLGYCQEITLTDAREIVRLKKKTARLSKLSRRLERLIKSAVQP